MKQGYQRGAIRASALLNVLLGAGIIGAVIFMIFSNTQGIVQEQQANATPPARHNIVVAAPPDANQIDKLKSTLEIETLKLERLRIQTERVRASQRRAQSVAPDTSVQINQANVSGLSIDGTVQAEN